MWISPKFIVQVTKWIEEWKLFSSENKSRFEFEINNLQPSTNILKEKQYSNKYKDILNAKSEILTPVGYIDLLTETDLIEIKMASNWKHAVGQLICYGTFYCNHQKWLYLFDHESISQSEKTSSAYPKYNKNQLKTIYINESGLYALVLNSKLPAAKQFKKWVTRELLPSIRKNLQTELIDYKAQLEEKTALLKSHESYYERLHRINEELLDYKKLMTKDENIYIVSTQQYAKQGLFKVGKTKDIKQRNSGHNTTRVAGDKIKVLATFKVNNASLVESTIHKKLNGLRPKQPSTEFFMCPYDQLYDIIDLIINMDETMNEQVNKIIDAVYKLKIKHFDHLDWMSGLSEDIFKDDMRLIEDGKNDNEQKEHVRFDMTNATEQQKKEFVRECIKAYRRTVLAPSVAERATTIVWKHFQPYMVNKLNISKKQFKAAEWKPLIKDVIESNIENANILNTENIQNNTDENNTITDILTIQWRGE